METHAADVPAFAGAVQGPRLAYYVTLTHFGRETYHFSISVRRAQV